MAQSNQPATDFAPSVSLQDDVTESAIDAGGTYFLGRYRVVDEIGVGGMASVHLARMDGAGGFQKWVAIKRIHPHLIEDEHFINMFLDEARIAARISHPNVAQVFDLGAHENTYWIAMEYLHGEPLREVMRLNEENGRTTTPELAARIIADAAEGLHAAHELRDKDGVILNLVHRDVSPHNLFITYEGMVKVVDFGIAKVSDRLSSTRAGTLKGKLAYMSPEQVRGAQIDRRTDIFALGVVLWELVTGRRLFRMESDLETLERVQACVVPPLASLIRGFPKELEAIIQKTLDKRPEARYQTARDLSRALQQFLIRTGRFVGSEEVGRYVSSLFADRIHQRESHLRWAAEVTQTISLQEVSGLELDSSMLEEVSLETLDEDENIPTVREVIPPITASDNPQEPGWPREVPATFERPVVAGAPPPLAPPGPLPPPSSVPTFGGAMAALPPAHGIHSPAPRLPPEIANPPPSSVMISATPPHYYEDEEEEEEIATIVALPRATMDGEPGYLPLVPFTPAYARSGAPLPSAGAPPSMGYGAGASMQGHRNLVPTVPPPPRTRRAMDPSGAAPSYGSDPYQHSPYAPRASHPYHSPPQQGRDYGIPSSQPFIPVGITPPPPSVQNYPMAVPAPLGPAIDPLHDRIMRQNQTLIYVAAGLGGLFVIGGIVALMLTRTSSEQPIAVAPQRTLDTVITPPPAGSATIVTAQPTIPTGVAPSVTVPTATTSAVAAAGPIDPTNLPTATPTTTSPPSSGGGQATAGSRTMTQSSPTSAATEKPKRPSSTGISVPSPTPATASDGGGNGFITVVCNPFCSSVRVGARGLGPSPIVNMPFPPGRYSIRLTWQSGTSKVVSRVVRSGEKAVVRVNEE